MHAAKALLGTQAATAAPTSKLNVVTFPGKAQADGSPGGPRLPAGQPRKWLRIDEQGKSAYIKVQSAANKLDHYPTLLQSLSTTSCSIWLLQVEKHQLVGYLNIPYRDLRIIDPLVCRDTCPTESQEEL